MIEEFYALGFFAFVFGCLIGSFLNVVIWRLPRQESLTGRSHCPKCNHQLNVLDLIPLIGFLFFRGKCRYCKAKVSVRYPIIEILTGGLFAFAYFLFPITDITSVVFLLKAFVVIAVCTCVFVIDLEHYLILDKIVFPIAILMLVFAFAFGQYSHIGAALLGFLPFWALWYFSKGKWMGFGDAKFAGLMGLILGLPGFIVALFLSFTLGALTGLSLMAAGKKDLGSKLPFGTFLALSTVISLFFGTKLWAFYWSLL